MSLLEAFIVRAKAACYVGDGNASEPSRTGSHDLTYHQGDFTYSDSYFGGTDFIGQETVWQSSAPIWAMNYYGRILRDDLLSSADAGRVIKLALSTMYAEGRFLGSFSHLIEYYQYTDTNFGDFRSFAGLETIKVKGIDAYQLTYHGGLIRP
jgi:hypothetical protein